MREQGFTLIELVTSLVIMAVITALAAPRFFDNRPYVARGFADEVADAVRYSQLIARSSRCEVRFTVDAAGAYSASQRSAAGNTCDPVGGWNVPVTRPDGSPVSGMTPSDIAPMAAATIEFTGDGRLVGNAQNLPVGTFTVSIEQESGFIRTLP